VSAANHPAVLSALWLLACLAAVGGVAATLKGPTVQAAVSRTAQRQPDGKRTEVAASALPGRALITGGLIALAGVLALGSQMRFETAAFAERLGQTQLAELNQSSGIGYLEEAVNNNAYEPVYATELGAAYLSIGTNHVDSGNPAYVPSAQAFRTLDPQQALNLGRDQLYTLAEESLQAARSDAPLDPDMYNNLGNLYLQWNRPVEALTVFRRAQALSANSPKYLDQEALAELQAGHAAYGRTLAEAGLQLDPTYWFTYYALAQLDHQLGAHVQAKNEARIALVTKANAYPPPPPQQVQQLQTIQRSG
jgi:hypothetical protein